MTDLDADNALTVESAAVAPSTAARLMTSTRMIESLAPAPSPTERDTLSARVAPSDVDALSVVDRTNTCPVRPTESVATAVSDTAR